MNPEPLFPFPPKRKRGQNNVPNHMERRQEYAKAAAGFPAVVCVTSGGRIFPACILCVQLTGAQGEPDGGRRG